MKKFLKIALIILLVAIIVVGAYFIIVKNTEKKALDIIDKMFTALKTGDESQIKEYVNLGEDEENTENESSEESEETEKMTKAMLKNLNYEVVSTKTNINKCVVNLKISNKDLKTVMGNYINKAFSLAFSQAFGGITEEELNNQLYQYFEEQYNSDSVGTLTSEVVITMKKVNGKWNVECDEKQLMNAILPGYEEVMSSLDRMEEQE